MRASVNSIKNNPVIVGVIGHRDPLPENKEKLFQTFTDILNAIQSINPNSQIVVVSPLADGADRIASKVAISSEKYRLIACLPFSREEYVEDFSDNSKIEFQEYLYSANEIWEPDSTEFQSRDIAYEKCAKKIVEVSDICIAFWDGELLNSIGGTSHTIHSILQSSAHQNTKLKLVHIDTPRSSFVRQRRETRFFNFSSGLWESKPEKDFFYLLKDALNEHLEDADTAESPLENLFLSVDDLANRNQQRYRKKIKQLFFLGFVTALFLSLSFATSSHHISIATLVTTVLLLLTWINFKQHNLKNKYESCRLLSETLRLELHLKSHNTFSSLRDTFLMYETGDLLWLRKSLIFNSIRHESTFKVQGNDEGKILSWLDGQLEYLMGKEGNRGAIKRNQSKSSSIHNWSKVPLLIALSGLTLQFLNSFSLVSLPSEYVFVTQLAWEVGLAGFASLIGYSEVLAFSDVATQLESKKNLMLAMREELISANNESKKNYIINSLMDASLSELQNWYSMNRNRTVRPI